MTTVHPERRAGQRWGFNGTGEFVLKEWDAAQKRWSTGGGVYWNDDCWDEGSVWQLTLIADSPAPGPDRAKCKAWCGHRTNEKDGAARLGRPLGEGVVMADNRTPREEWPVWCTEPCRSAKVPPLESRPAEPGKCSHGHLHHCADCDIARAIAAQKPAQEAPKATVCMWNERHKCNLPIRERVVKVGTISLCDWAMHQSEKLIASRTVGSGTPYAGPERLPRPKMAHVGGNHDDDLVTW